MAKREGGKGKRSLRPRSTTPVEWAAAVLGAIIVVLMIGCLTWYGIQDGNGRPDISIVQDGPVRTVSGGYGVGFIARNAGGGTAAELNIVGELRADGEIIEQSTATIDYLPGHSERRGGLFFRNDPRAAHLAIYPTGYEKP